MQSGGAGQETVEERGTETGAMPDRQGDGGVVGERDVPVRGRDGEDVEHTTDVNDVNKERVREHKLW